MVQGWPGGGIISTSSIVGCTGVCLNMGNSASVGWGWQGVSGIGGGCVITNVKKIKLEVGKMYRCKSLISYTLNKSTDICIKVFGPTATQLGCETVRVKYWDSQFKEWDQNTWVATEQPETSVEEIGRLEALVVYGAVG